MKAPGYYVVPDWATDLQDIDIWETIILAVIYGFSQDGESVFNGSQNYLARMAKCSKRKVASALDHLVELDYIRKIDKAIQGVKFCEYAINEEVVHRMHTLCTACIPYAPHATNNIDNKIDKENSDINITIKEKKENPQRTKEFQVPTIAEIAEYCASRNNGIDAEEFYHYYESVGWKVGNKPMNRWQSAVITWEKSRRNKNYGNTHTTGHRADIANAPKADDFPSTL